MTTRYISFVLCKDILPWYAYFSYYLHRCFILQEQSDTQPAGAVQRDCSALSDSQLVDLFDAHLEQLSGVRGVTLYQTKSIVADRMNNDGWPHNATVHSLKFRKSTEKRHPKTHAKLLAALNAVEFELQSFFAHEGIKVCVCNARFLLRLIPFNGCLFYHIRWLLC